MMSRHKRVPHADENRTWWRGNCSMKRWATADRGRDRDSRGCWQAMTHAVIDGLQDMNCCGRPVTGIADGLRYHRHARGGEPKRGRAGGNDDTNGQIDV